MRFLSLLALSGCALVDANQDPHGGGDGGDGRTFTITKIADLSSSVQLAIPADLDGVGPIDLLVLSDSNLIACFNQGGGTFAVVQIEGGYQVIGAGDLDGDGLDEAIGAAFSGGVPVLDVHQKSGPDTFTRTQLPGETRSATPNQIITGHFPFLGPQGRSIVLSYGATNSVRVIAGALVTPVVRDIPTDIAAFDMIAAEIDTNSPGTDELLIAANTVIEAQGDASNQTFIPRPRTYANALRVTAGHYFGNSNNDLAYARKDLGGQSLVYIGGTPTGLPDDQVDPVDVGEPNLDALALATGDFSGDGLDDVALLAGSNRVLHVFTTQAQGEPIETTFTLGGTPSSMAAGDFDGDDVSDLVIVPGDGGGVDLLLSR